MEDSYHYPPEVLNLLVDTVPLLCKSKNDVLVFFRGSGVSETITHDLADRVRTDREGINKYEIARTVVQRINEKGDSELKTRRELLKRVVEFENFSTCWPSDQLKAKGLVSELREVINVKDSFTRMSQERKREKQKNIDSKEKERSLQYKKRKEIELVKSEFYSLFGMDNEPHKRGKRLEKVLNDLFSLYGILIKEDFKRVDQDGAGIIEQIDGVISISGHIYLVEMKWVKEPIGVEALSPHIVRVFGRHDARGLVIASQGFTKPALAQCREVLSQKTIALITLQELFALLERQSDLIQFVERKVQAATVDKNPYLEILN